VEQFGTHCTACRCTPFFAGKGGNRAYCRLTSNDVVIVMYSIGVGVLNTLLKPSGLQDWRSNVIALLFCNILP
jgi:hypothetical protein